MEYMNSASQKPHHINLQTIIHLSLLNDGSSGRIEEIDQTSFMSSSMRRSTVGEKIRRKFHRCIENFLTKGGVMFL